MSKAACPACEHEYELAGIVPPEAKGATIRCSECGYEFDLAPGTMFGWRSPKVSLRPEQRAK